MIGEHKKPNATRRLYFAGLYLAVMILLFVGAMTFFIIRAKHSHKNPKTNSKEHNNGLDWKTSADILIQELSPLDSHIFVKLSQPSSAEWKALQWMIIKDEVTATATSTATATATATAANTNTTRTLNLIQRFALVTTYIHFDLPLHTDLHECEWIGVQCGNVNKITDGGSGLADTITDASIVVTDLNFTTLKLTERTIPTALAYVPFLTSLDLSSQSLVGTIPVGCYTGWTHIMHLNLDHNKLTKLFAGMLRDGAPTTVWPSLVHLSAVNNDLQEEVHTGLAQWSHLKSFNMKGNSDLTGPLFECVLRSNRPHWEAIEDIDISETSLVGSIPDRLLLPNLVTLVAVNTQLTGTLPESLQTATKLEVLSLGILPWARWTGTLPDSYSALTSIKHLMLSNLNGITGTLPASWGGSWKDIRSVDLYRNPRLTGPVPTSWTQMTNLVYLRLSATGVSGTIPSEIGQLTHLITLSLFRTNLVGSMPNEICDLRVTQVLRQLEADCRNSEFGEDAPVSCSPDCCTLCANLDTRHI